MLEEQRRSHLQKQPVARSRLLTPIKLAVPGLLGAVDEAEEASLKARDEACSLTDGALLHRL